MDKALEQIYYGTSPGALRGPRALCKQAKKEGLNVTLKQCKEYLKSQSSYTLYKPARRNYKRNRIRANYPGEIYQIDIWDMQRFKPYNDYAYILLGYDSFSKYLTAVPLKNRKPETIESALTSILENLPFAINTIYWDSEGGFMSHRIQSYLRDRKINNYTTTSKVKAPGVERAIRTRRMAVQRYFEANNTWKWQDYVPIFVQNYNNRVHSTTRHKPIDLIRDPNLLVYQKPIKKPKVQLPPIGAFVRLNRLRSLFDKEASGSYTKEVFRVVQHKLNAPIPMIKVEDLLGEPLKGALYPEEYTEIDWDGKKKIDKVLKTRTKSDKTKEYFVSFDGWPPKFNAWVDKLE